jgi:hypothetical protein
MKLLNLYKNILEAKEAHEKKYGRIRKVRSDFISKQVKKYNTSVFIEKIKKILNAEDEDFREYTAENGIGEYYDVWSPLIDIIASKLPGLPKEMYHDFNYGNHSTDEDEIEEFLAHDVLDELIDIVIK